MAIMIDCEECGTPFTPESNSSSMCEGCYEEHYGDSWADPAGGDDDLPDGISDAHYDQYCC